MNWGRGPSIRGPIMLGWFGGGHPNRVSKVANCDLKNGRGGFEVTNCDLKDLITAGVRHCSQTAASALGTEIEDRFCMSDDLKSQIAISKQPLRAADISQHIHIIRGHRVMLDADLAELYGVTTKSLNQAVKRNTGRFPEDFAFRLTTEEAANLKSQIVTSSLWGGRRRSLPLAFTEQGVAMLSGVLNSPRAIQVNVAIMRAFVRMREAMSSDRELARPGAWILSKRSMPRMTFESEGSSTPSGG